MTIHEMISDPTTLSVEKAGELLDLPRIEYYRWINRAEYLSKVAQEDLFILVKIR